MMKIIARIYFGLIGWKLTSNRIPLPLNKVVMIAAPHTSNWDFPIAMAALYLMDVRVRYLAKKELFSFPLGILLRAMGGIPVDRSKNNNLVDSMVDAFHSHDKMIMLIPPEGTRGYVKEWKSGFYHVAVKAEVPIIIGYLDYKKKKAGILDPFYPTGDYEADVKILKNMCRIATPKYPELSSLND